jgi:hypothetical protein
MEIQEITFYYLYEGTKQVEVSFRLTSDSEDEIRNDTINLQEAKEFGYDLIEESFNFFIDEDDIEEEDDEDFQSIDEEQLLSFLNEYYIVNPKKLPKAEVI